MKLWILCRELEENELSELEYEEEDTFNHDSQERKADMYVILLSVFVMLLDLSHFGEIVDRCFGDIWFQK